MKCVKCGGEMEQGVTFGAYNQQIGWAKSINRLLALFIGGLVDARKMVTHRCTSCGYLESYAK
jgi:hypothetical protein